MNLVELLLRAGHGAEQVNSNISNKLVCGGTSLHSLTGVTCTVEADVEARETPPLHLPSVYPLTTFPEMETWHGIQIQVPNRPMRLSPELAEFFA